MIKDVENFRDDMVAILQAGLPARIAAINLEKADGNDLTPVPNADYYPSTGAQEWNVNPFIHYGISEITNNTKAGFITGVGVTLYFEIIFIENLDGTKTMDRVLRYTRAMQQVIQCAFRDAKISYASMLEVQPFTPVNVLANDQSTIWKVGGIQVTAALAQF